MPQLKRILVPLDGSLLSESALVMAKTLAQPFRSEIVLLQVLRIFTTFRNGYQELNLDWETEAQGYAAYQKVEAYLQAKQDELQTQGFDVRPLVCGARANETISDVIIAQKADLIVMATHGRGGLARWASSSIADEVVRHSHCPVLLVRRSEEEGSNHEGKRVSVWRSWLKKNSQFFGGFLPELRMRL
jgi:nucleotide-binding universal stress UspA family protein